MTARMSAQDTAKYQQFLDWGWTREELDERLFASGRPPRSRRRPVDPRLAASALDLDILDTKIERAKAEQFVETVAALRRLGIDATKLGPPLPERLPGEPTHLARVCGERQHDPLEPGLVRRPAGDVL